MQIIIPMAGFGERFRKKGYTIPKPLIEIEGKPMIAHVIDLFPDESDITFICNREHLETPRYKMESTIKKYCKTAKILAIPPHKFGPVYSVMQVIEDIDLSKPTIVNYCDFSCLWDWYHFKQFVLKSKVDGAIPCYRGFHPHSLGSTYYAYIKTLNDSVIDIQEKQPFTDSPMNEYASSGTYYFASGSILKKYFNTMILQELNTNQEYYVSLAYIPMLADNCKVVVYEISHFMQWGTPEDLAEYKMWSAAFLALISPRVRTAKHKGAVFVPMAGQGQRFLDAGYQTPKPLIPVSGKAMAIQAINDLPITDKQYAILRADLPYISQLILELKNNFPTMNISILDQITDGQARTCMSAMNNIEVDLPLTIGACDNGSIYDTTKFENLLSMPDTDIIVWTTKEHALAKRKPEMFGWIESTPENKVTRVSVKAPLNNPSEDSIIIGCFTFKRAGDFSLLFESLINRKGEMNGEYYIDSMIEDALNIGMNVYIFDVDHYLGWGVPDDLNIFSYWQSCFHKWNTHHYCLTQDNRVPVESQEQRFESSPIHTYLEK
ncbi:NTP transferase domain-containing protein [Shewanella woodyi]|uniref:Nucleotidyl transferase domain-containing protein n=1 Tax=Shewanella woodyi (strain ATCC 51908 / MS32) TaxID=392500 RepID=B1KQP1_SHEWM|nr:sugar phosphate nucleotidyltransferase [Shewanella woodyi]ACA86280.1 conserved hypothetical protein [Shewanella woodyi ATCC 51908]